MRRLPGGFGVLLATDASRIAATAKLHRTIITASALGICSSDFPASH
jgi:hypothetical protein